MGLDVYLIKYHPGKTKEDDDKISEEYEERSGEIFSKYPKADDMTEVEKKKLRAEMKKLQKKMGVGQFGITDGVVMDRININSLKNPDHIFKIGYLRSSYNDAGTNSVWRNSIGMDLYDVFRYDEDNAYEFQPDWKWAKKITEEMMTKYREFFDKYGGVSVMHMTSFRSGVKNGREALAVYKNQIDSKKSPFNCYENSDGFFSLDEPLKVKAIILGGDNCYVIHDSRDSDNVEGDFYFQALEITKEMIEYVLNDKRNIKQYYLRWSG